MAKRASESNGRTKPGQPKRAIRANRSRERRAGASRVRFSKTDLALIDQAVDRYIERWARKLLIVDGRGIVRRLTEEEVQTAVGRKSSSPRKKGRTPPARRR